MIFCDKCLIPVMGFAWRLFKEDKGGDLYDLCCTHYNANEDAYSDNNFYCNIPTGRIKRESRRLATLRVNTRKLKLLVLVVIHFVTYWLQILTQLSYLCKYINNSKAVL